MARAWLLVIALGIFIGLTGNLTLAGVNEKFDKPNEYKSWGEQFLDFVGIPGYAKSYAVLIGISEFTGGFEPLPTERDAIRLKEYLIREAGFDHVYVLTDELATEERIEELMEDEIPTRLGSEDRFLFYWSGHGTQRKIGEKYHGYLPVASSAQTKFSTMVSMDDIERWAGLLEAKQALFLLDACFSGLAGVVPKNSPRELTIEQLAMPSVHLLTAGTGNQKTIAGDIWGGSLFTTAVIDGLRGEADTASVFSRDGIVSLSELVAYLKTRVATEQQAAGWNQAITPQLRDLRTNEGEFFFVSNSFKVDKRKSAGVSPNGEFEFGEPIMVKSDEPVTYANPEDRVQTARFPESAPNTETDGPAGSIGHVGSPIDGVKELVEHMVKGEEVLQAIQEQYAGTTDFESISEYFRKVILSLERILEGLGPDSIYEKQLVIVRETIETRIAESARAYKRTEREAWLTISDGWKRLARDYSDFQTKLESIRRSAREAAAWHAESREIVAEFIKLNQHQYALVETQEAQKVLASLIELFGETKGTGYYLLKHTTLE